MTDDEAKAIDAARDAIARLRLTSGRWFFSTDQSSHWYLVPDERRAEWHTWQLLDEDDERSWQVPPFAYRISSHGSWTFTDPRQS